uniref:Uncharacterized protein n=1 Tax=Tanacetum cinerariifolium TaxID=118510 RepID=A0A6L2K5L5_TANCI|nr:hypothetical protein [Tanacetum cinerariifolium]
MQEVMTKAILKEYEEKAQTESNLSYTNINDDVNIELIKEFLMGLKNNAYHEMFDEDAVDHIAKVLELLDLIKIPGVDTDRLRMKVFLSLANDVKQWWIDKGDGKITAWGILIGRFFCKYFPFSCNDKNYIISSYNKDGYGYYELMTWLDSRQYDKRVDRMTKSALFHSWIYGWGNDESTDYIVSSDEEWEEFDYENPPNTAIDSFLKPWLKTHEINNIKKGDERNQQKRKGNYCNLEIDIPDEAPKSDIMDDERPIKRVRKTKKFEAIKYSLVLSDLAVRRIHAHDMAYLAD